MQLVLDRCLGVKVRSHAWGGSQVVGCSFDELGVKRVHTLEQIVLVQCDVIVHQLRQSLCYQLSVVFQAIQIYAVIANMRAVGCSSVGRQQLTSRCCQ